MKAQGIPMEQRPVQRYSELCHCMFVLQGGTVEYPVLSRVISLDSMTSGRIATLN